MNFTRRFAIALAAATGMSADLAASAVDVTMPQKDSIIPRGGGQLNSVRAFGALGDGATDDTQAFQHALDFCASHNRTLFIPDGEYFFAQSSPSLDLGTGGLSIVGESRTNTRLLFEQSSGREKHLFRNSEISGQKELEFRNFQIVGTTADETAGIFGGNAMQLRGYPSITLRDIWASFLRRMGIEILRCGRLECTGCWFTDIASDALRARDVSNCIITNNFFWRNGDDSIALHTSDEHLKTNSPREGLIVANNMLINAGIIKCLGARKTIITGNMCRLSNINSIQVGTFRGGVEGHNATEEIIISDNVLSDLVYVQKKTVKPGNAFIVIGGEVDFENAIESTGSEPFCTQPPPNSGLNELAHGNGHTRTGEVARSIRIANNTLQRTVSGVKRFSDLGHGKILRLGVEYDPELSDFLLTPSSGISLGEQGRFSDVLISGNSIRNVASGISIKAPRLNFDMNGVTVVNNSFYSTSQSGVRFAGGRWKVRAGIGIRGNDFNIDPYRINNNSDPDGSYKSPGTPTAIDLGEIVGAHVIGNQFRNCCTVIAAADLDRQLIRSNVLHLGEPVTVNSYSKENLGIGVPPALGNEWDYVIIVSDSRVEDCGQVMQVVPSHASELPTTGWFPRGWIVKSSAPRISSGAKLCTIGWLRLTTGNKHEAGEDWIELVNTSV